MDYTEVDGWFNMEEQYRFLLSKVPEGGIFVEIGAWMGRSTLFMAQEIQKQGRNVHFYTVDTFAGSPDEPDYEKYKYLNIREIFNNNLKDHWQYVYVLDGDSVEASKVFFDGEIDAIFVDGGHTYPQVRADLEAWIPKVKSHGIISGHDYDVAPGVRKAVDEFFEVRRENNCWFAITRK